MTIYLDIVILENLIMNYIILYVTGTINKVEMHIWKLLLSSMLGSAYAVITYLSIVQGYLGFIFKILLSIAMIHIAFQPNHYKTMGKHIVLFYLVSFALGGCAFFLLYYIKPQNILMKNGVFIGTYPIKIAILGGLLGAIVITIAFNIRKGKIRRKDMFCEIEICFKKHSIKVKAMLDTGNLLREPITGTPVIVVEKEEIKQLLSEEMLKNLSNLLQGKEADPMDPEHISRFRVIPFSSLGRQNGMLLGFRPDDVFLYWEEQKILKRNVMIGIYEKSLTKNGAYTALIGLDLIEGGKENESIASIKV